MKEKKDLRGTLCECGGTFQETSIYDDWDGVLHCTECKRKVGRYEEIAKYSYAYELLDTRNKDRKVKVPPCLAGLATGCDPRGKVRTHTGKYLWKATDKDERGFYPGGGLVNPMEMISEEGDVIYIHTESWIEFVE